MTTLGRTKSALLVIDVQNQVVQGAFNKDQVIANINTAVGKARAAGVPVVWIQHSDDWMAIGSEDWQIVPQLTPAEGETKVGSCIATPLRQLLWKWYWQGLAWGMCMCAARKQITACVTQPMERLSAVMT